MHWSSVVTCWLNGLRVRIIGLGLIRAGARECTFCAFFPLVL